MLGREQKTEVSWTSLASKSKYTYRLIMLTAFGSVYNFLFNLGLSKEDILEEKAKSHPSPPLTKQQTLEFWCYSPGVPADNLLFDGIFNMDLSRAVHSCQSCAGLPNKPQRIFNDMRRSKIHRVSKPNLHRSGLSTLSDKTTVEPDQRFCQQVHT
ncbi:hypothetical protein PoB_004454500 [Plakobranchus ocellatus]|uniref:Uncharacterized protein n=1 Tax=Plakobranchus ocellatus TaxID=259542 RepID=A0AAV4BBP6_9GAST|nr:hypothetical protein PoB_004454500 [Plakobranchus ocellatus]